MKPLGKYSHLIFIESLLFYYISADSDEICGSFATVHAFQDSMMPTVTSQSLTVDSDGTCESEDDCPPCVGWGDNIECKTPESGDQSKKKCHCCSSQTSCTYVRTALTTRFWGDHDSEMIQYRMTSSSMLVTGSDEPDDDPDHDFEWNVGDGTFELTAHAWHEQCEPAAGMSPENGCSYSSIQTEFGFGEKATAKIVNAMSAQKLLSILNKEITNEIFQLLQQQNIKVNT